MEFTWPQIGFAIGLSLSIIATMLSVAVFVVGRIDAKAGRKEKTADKDLAQAVESRKLEHAETVSGDDLLLKIIDLKDAEITGLKADLTDARQANQLSRPTVTNVYAKVRELEKILHSLLIQPCPDEVANILNERMGQAKEKLAELRDLLP